MGHRVHDLWQKGTIETGCADFRGYPRQGSNKIEGTDARNISITDASSTSNMMRKKVTHHCGNGPEILGTVGPGCCKAEKIKARFKKDKCSALHR